MEFPSCPAHTDNGSSIVSLTPLRCRRSDLTVFISDMQVHRNEGIIYMVLECGDIDLARLLQASGGCRTLGACAGNLAAEEETYGCSEAVWPVELAGIMHAMHAMTFPLQDGAAGPPLSNLSRRPMRACRSTRRRGRSTSTRTRWTRTSSASTGSRCCRCVRRGGIARLALLALPGTQPLALGCAL